MEKIEKEKIFKIVGIVFLFIIIGFIICLAISIYTIGEIESRMEPWRELYDCVEFRTSTRDETDEEKMKSYYSVLKENPYIYAVLSERERDYFTADKTVLYANIEFNEQSIEKKKKQITFYYVFICILSIAETLIIFGYKPRTKRENNK